MSRNPRLLPTTRVEAFSDGVYAIAVTLLVLELGVPESSERLLEKLADDWPSFLGYLVSFSFIGGSWVAHVKLTRSLSAVDDVFVGLNLLKLLFVSFLPFTTSVMANHVADASQRPAAVLFGLNLTLASAMSLVLSGYAIRVQTLVREGEHLELRRHLRERWPFFVMLGLSTVVGAFLPVVAVIFYLAISAFMLIRPLLRLNLANRTQTSTGPRPGSG
ncbi:DUF1211 domain-containing protein [Mycobacterium sp. Y57]|uniref:TMEM175 family protein n=1 Tax=Mycolicibacterium xanthum TaxID=2796469 RepID=UPI001C862878|nr:TMEM175 family protein [Mycolicibacterium xanthum]MBX7435426.1 DUF1211 domain-containing protein [Mycolicibacterium xanthum]